MGSLPETNKELITILENIFLAAQKAHIDKDVDSKFVKCAFLAEIGELVDCIDYKWWTEKDKSLTDTNFKNIDNFYIELADSTILALKLFKDRLGKHDFIEKWSELFDKTPPHKEQDSAKLSVEFSSIIHDNAFDVSKLISFYKRFVDLCHDYFRQEGISNIYREDEDLIFIDLILGKILLVYRRLSGVGIYNQNKYIRYKTSIENLASDLKMEDNIILLRMWKKGILRKIIEDHMEDSDKIEGGFSLIFNEFNSHFENMLSMYSKTT